MVDFYRLLCVPEVTDGSGLIVTDDGEQSFGTSADEETMNGEEGPEVEMKSYSSHMFESLDVVPRIMVMDTVNAPRHYTEMEDGQDFGPIKVPDLHKNSTFRDVMEAFKQVAHGHKYGSRYEHVSLATYYFVLVDTTGGGEHQHMPDGACLGDTGSNAPLLQLTPKKLIQPIRFAGDSAVRSPRECFLDLILYDHPDLSAYGMRLFLRCHEETDELLQHFKAVQVLSGDGEIATLEDVKRCAHGLQKWTDVTMNEDGDLTMEPLTEQLVLAIIRRLGKMCAERENMVTDTLVGNASQQAMLRNMEVHHKVIGILKRTIASDGTALISDVRQMCHQALLKHFCINNPLNQAELYRDLDFFLQEVDRHGHVAVETVGEIFRDNLFLCGRLSEDIICSFVNKLDGSDDCVCYVKLLMLLVNVKGIPFPRNQSVIATALLKRRRAACVVTCVYPPVDDPTVILSRVNGRKYPDPEYQTVLVQLMAKCCDGGNKETSRMFQSEIPITDCMDCIVAPTASVALRSNFVQYINSVFFEQEDLPYEMSPESNQHDGTWGSLIRLLETLAEDVEFAQLEVDAASSPAHVREYFSYLFEAIVPFVSQLFSEHIKGDNPSEELRALGNRMTESIKFMLELKYVNTKERNIVIDAITRMFLVGGHAQDGNIKRLIEEREQEGGSKTAFVDETRTVEARDLSAEYSLLLNNELGRCQDALLESLHTDCQLALQTCLDEIVSTKDVFKCVIQRIVDPHHTAAWRIPRTVMTTLRAVTHYVTEGDLEDQADLHCQRAGSSEDFVETARHEEHRAQRVYRQQQLGSWQAMDLVLLSIIGGQAGGDNMELLDLALEAGIQLLRDGSDTVQELLLTLLNTRRFKDFNAEICKHIMRYAHDMQQRQRLLEKLSSTLRIEGEHDASGATTEELPPGAVAEEELGEYEDHRNLCDEDRIFKEEMSNLMEFEKEMLADPVRKEIVPGNNAIMKQILRFLTYMCRNLSLDLQDWLRGEGQQSQRPVDVVKAVSLCIESFAADVDILSLHYVELVTMLFQACRAFMMGPNKANQHAFVEENIVYNTALIIQRHRDDFDGRLLRPKYKGGRLEDRGGKEYVGTPLEDVMKPVLRMRNAGTELLLAVIEEDQSPYSLTKVVLDVSKNDMYSEILYDIGLSLGVTFQELMILPFTSFKLERNPEYRMEETVILLKDLFKTYGVNCLILMLKVITAYSEMQKEEYHFVGETMAQKTMRVKEMERLVLLYSRFTEDPRALSMFYNSITQVDVSRTEGSYCEIVFETPARCDILDQEFETEKRQIIDRINRDANNAMEKLTAFIESFETIEVEMAQIERIFPIFRVIVRRADAFVNFSSVVTIAINCILLFFATGHRVTSESKLATYDENQAQIHTTIKTALTVSSVLQMISLSVAMLAFLTKQMPAIIANAQRENVQKRIAQETAPRQSSLLGTRGKVKRGHDGGIKLVKPLSNWEIAKTVLFTVDFLYMICVFGFAVGALIWEWCSVFLLIGVLMRVRRTADLLLTVVSVGGQAFLILLMGVVTTYCHSLIVFLHMNGRMYYNGEFVCDKLYKCVVIGVWKGITSPGGIGDILTLPVWHKEQSTYTMLFNVFFYMVVSLMQHSIIVALVARAFSDLRFNAKKRMYLEEFKCFICGLDRKQFSSVDEFHVHRSEFHDPWKYMKLRIYLQEKMARHRHELTGIEDHMAEQMQLLNDTEVSAKVEVLKFMPIRARGEEMIVTTDSRTTKPIDESLGSIRLSSLMAGVKKQCDVLRVMRLENIG